MEDKTWLRQRQDWSRDWTVNYHTMDSFDYFLSLLFHFAVLLFQSEIISMQISVFPIRFPGKVEGGETLRPNKTILNILIKLFCLFKN